MVKKKKYKIISAITILFILITLVSIKNINANANNTSTTPSFTISDLTATPNPAKVGEDILVSGTIIPQDFITTPQPKEIVLVLDTSGSMNDYITVDEECRERRILNFCFKHFKSGNHNDTRRKIEEIKKAAKSFIERMQDVSNLKIGIVEYNTDSKIVSELKSADDSALITEINRLNAGGGTNIKEGLRKATYLLDKEKTNASKTIVLMTDGEPTYYSKYDTLDNSNPRVYGLGSYTNSETIKYTNDFAKEQIASRSYSAYSIGYGLDNNGEDYLKQIHSSMKGIENYIDIGEEDGFYAKSNESITDIFNKIADDIKNSYDLNNITLDISFNEDFKLNIGGNEIKIGNIVYNKKEVNGNTGNIIYHADPIDFSFIVKASEIGEGQTILDNIDIKFLFKDQNIRNSWSEEVKIDIISNELPIIDARLKSDAYVIINENEETVLEYEIQPQDFTFNDENNLSESDVVFVIDVSKDMSKYLAPLRNAIWNDIVNNNKLKASNTEYDFITFSEDVINIVDLSSSDYRNYNEYITDLNNNYIKTKIVEESIVNNSPTTVQPYRIDHNEGRPGEQEGGETGNDNAGESNSNEDEDEKIEPSENSINEYENNGARFKNLYKTYNDIIRLLDEGREGARKNVIFISENTNLNTGDKNEENYKRLKGKNFNIITLEIGTLNDNSVLKNLHTDLGGNESYFNTQDQNQIQNQILKDIAKIIEKNIYYKDYTFNPKLQINLNGNFILVSGHESIEGNKGIISTPKVVYKYSKEDKKYKAENSTVQFTVRPISGRIGTLNFGEDSKLVYKKLINDNLKYSKVETPVVTVRQLIKNLTHGLYNGVIENKPNVQENDEGRAFEMAEKSTVNFGAKFSLGGNSTEFNLNIDKKFNSVSEEDIKIYKVLRDSSENITLVEILGEDKNVESKGNNNFSIAIDNIKDNDIEEYTEILVVYKGRIKDNSSGEEFLNKIEFTSVSKNVKVSTPEINNDEPSLPDLF